MIKEKYWQLVSEWAEKDSRWVKTRGESRSKWRRIRWNTINNWQVTEKEKKELYDKYVQLMDNKAPVIVHKTAPKESSIISMF